MFDLEPMLAGAPDTLIAVALHDLETGQQYFRNADEPLHPASTIKVHVMMEVFRQANEGSLALEDRLPIINAFTSVADGSLFALDVVEDSEQTLYARLGETESIQELTRLMIVRSSNLATNILLETVGARHVNDFIRTLGIEGVTVLRGVEDVAAFDRGMNNRATARGLMQTMELIARRSVVSEGASQRMIEILLGQEFNESIPAPLPDSVMVAHKTGWADVFFHDTGIVFRGDRAPYVLTIMTRGFAEDRATEAHQCMASVSKAIYEGLQ